MDGGAPETAFDRIETAVARIERALKRRADDSETLRARHDRLKAAVTQSLGELDELIASQGK